MLNHPKLTEKRIANFLENSRRFYYAAYAPLEVTFVNLGLGDVERPGEYPGLSGKNPEKSEIRDQKSERRKTGPGTPTWRRVTIGARWGGNWETAWFRFKGRVPKEWHGQEVWAVIDTGSEACVYDSKGEPVCGLTSGDEWSRKALVPVARRAEGGEPVEILVEAVANHLFGVLPDCHLKEARLVLFRRDGWEFFHDFRFLHGLQAALPEDHPRRAQIRYALNEAVNRYGGAPAPVPAVFRPERDMTDFCSGKSDRVPGPQVVRAARQALAEQLSRPANASAHKVSAIGHSHLDLAWLWPLRETIRKAARTFSSALSYMREYPEYRFSASQPWVYEAVKERFPGLYERVKQAVKDGRWELLGGMWVEADCNVTGGESLVRQFLFGKRFFLEEFGTEIDNMWMPDVFGYSAALPQIMKLAGVKYFTTTKMCWNQFNRFPYNTFDWEGLDGSTVLAHLPPADRYEGNLEPRELLFAARNFAEKDRCSRWLYSFGFGDGGGGPSRHYLEYARRCENCEELPRVTQEFASDFFTKAEAEQRDRPRWRGEMYLELHRGTLTTQARNKRANRKAEFLLREAEFLASAFPKEYPREEFDRIWKILLLNQFHDIIPGSSINWVYKDTAKHYEEILGFAHRVIDEFGGKLAAKADTSGKGEPFVVVNSLSWDRTDLVELPRTKPAQITDGEGNVLPCQVSGDKLLVRAKVPAMGHTVLRVNSQSPMTNAQSRASAGHNPIPSSELGLCPKPAVSAQRLENELLRVEFDRQGNINRLLDKEAGREVIPQGCLGNVLALYEDLPAANDAWDVDIFYEEKPPQETELVSCRIGEAGPLRVSLVQERRVGTASKLTQEIRLAAGSRRLEFVTRVDWHEKHRMLRTSFPVSVRAEQATYEIQYGHVQRPTHRNTPWDMAKFEVAAHKWADLSDPGYGVALLNDCKYGHKVLGNVLDLNLLRSPTFPDPGADMGEHEFTYALFPHIGGFREAGVIQEAYGLNVPLRAFAAGIHKGPLPETASRFRLDKPNVIIEAVKLAEPAVDLQSTIYNLQSPGKPETGNRKSETADSSVVLRLYEAHGVPTEAEFDFAGTQPAPRRVFKADLLERPLEELKLVGNRLRLKLRPFEIVTLKMEKKEKRGRGTKGQRDRVTK